MKQFLILVGILVAVVATGFWYGMAQAAGCNPFLVATGGTGNCAFVSNTVLYGNGTGKISTTTAATNGFILAWVNGVPTPVATTTFSSGLTYLNGNVTNTGVLSITATPPLSRDSATGVVTVSCPTCSSSGSIIATTTGLTISQVPYYTSISPTIIGGTSTTTLAGTGVISISNTPYVFGASPAVASLTGGTAGQHLIWSGGLPTWAATSTYATSTASSGGFGFSFVNNVVNLLLPSAGASTPLGLLTAADWSTFNGKQASGNYITALTTDVTASGPGSVAATIAANAVTYAKFQTVAANSVVGNITGSTANAAAIATSSLFSFPWSYANGGTGTTTQYTGGVFFGDGTKITQAPNTGTGVFFWDNTNFRLGIASTSPQAPLSLGSGNASTSALIAEYAYGRSGNLATSTAMNIGPRTSNNILWPIGFSATTLTLCGFAPGDSLTVTVRNPNGTAGALTWAACAGTQLQWAAKTVPTQTTTANDWDVWSFKASSAVGSTTAAIIMISGAASTGF